MPEEFEVPEKPNSQQERVVGLIIAAIAVVLAIVTHLGNETNNEKILAHVDASDQFAFFQAKKARLAQLELTLDQMKLDHDRLSTAAQTEADKLTADYAAQAKKLDDDAKEIKEKGDELLGEARLLEKKATYIEFGEIALQIAVVICSICILTDQLLFARMGVCAAVVGIVFAAWGTFFIH